MGNLRSVSKALEAAGAEVVLSRSPAVLGATNALCVPGQGIFGRCREVLHETGVADLVRKWIDGGLPYLGICLGMQILFETSAERGPIAGLGILAGDVVRLPGTVTVPHIGWNEVAGEHYYFDHSYAPIPADPEVVEAWCDHGIRFAALIRSGSVFATQFHPEKSGRAGISLLSDWVKAVA
ncbi:MAG: imidazole glycerol phosphate synthase subunit HisH [Actinomycetota bacterium]|nr:imidazole glycerol phosphate synthase subunit HisH [Actinomycetota bacterium]